MPEKMSGLGAMIGQTLVNINDDLGRLGLDDQFSMKQQEKFISKNDGYQV
jgi:hypothetical protein